MSRKVTGVDTHSPKGSLVEAIEIGREAEIQNPSLHIKLQNELAKPLNHSIRKGAADTTRIKNLKADGLDSNRFLDSLH